MRGVRARLAFFFAEAIDEWRNSPGVNLLATATLAAVLFVGGLFLAVLGSVSGGLDEWKNDAWISVYLRDGVAPDAERALADSLESVPGVGVVERIEPEEALRRFREWYGEFGEVAAELEENPLPASFEVRAAPGEDPTALALRVMEIATRSEIVEDVRYDRELLETLEGAVRLTAGVGGIVGAAVLAAVAIVVGGVFRLAVLARTDEIEIMQLVGATPGLVRGPFVVAGACQGALAGFLGGAAAEGARRVVLTGADGGALLDLVAGAPLAPAAWLLLVAIGSLVGVAGALVAVRRV